MADTNILDEMAVKESDLAYRLLNGLFDSHSVGGEALGEVSSGMAHLLAEQASIFNSIVLTAMAIMIGAASLTALVNTNYEGTAFGGKVHTIWGPVRIVIAIMALAPMPGGGGFSVIQNMVVKANYASIGFASYMSRKGVDRLGIAIDEGVEIDPRSEFVLAETEQVVTDLINMFGLAHYAESRRYRDNDPAGPGAGVEKWQNDAWLNKEAINARLSSFRKLAPTTHGDYDGRLVTFDNHLFEIWAYDRELQNSVGGLAFFSRLSSDHKKVGGFYYSRLGKINISCDKAGDSSCGQRVKLVKDLIDLVNIATLASVWNAIDHRTVQQQRDDYKLGKEFVAAKVDFESFYKKIIAFQNNYRKIGISKGDYKEKAKLIHEAVKTRVDRDGFLMLGATHISLSSILETVSKQAGKMPSSNTDELEEMMENYGKDIVSVDNKVQFYQVIKNTRALMGGLIDSQEEALMLKGKEPNSAFSKALNAILGAPFSLMPNVMEVKIGEDPLLRLQSTGHTMVGLLEGVVIANAVVQATRAGVEKSSEGVEETLKSVPAVGDTAKGAYKTTVGFGVAFASSLAESAIGVSEFFIMAMLIPALAMAYYLPFVPLLLWVIASAGLFVVMVESVIAAPVWAAAHSSSEGDGLMGVHARAGYMLMLGALLRAPLMVFAFFLSFELMDLMIFMFNSMFDLENKALASNIMVSGLVTYVAMIYLYVLVVILLEHKIFGLVTWLPDNVINWAGQTMGRTLGHDAKGEASSIGGSLRNLPGGSSGPGIVGAAMKGSGSPGGPAKTKPEPDPSGAGAGGDNPNDSGVKSDDSNSSK